MALKDAVSSVPVKYFCGLRRRRKTLQRCSTVSKRADVRVRPVRQHVAERAWKDRNGGEHGPLPWLGRRKVMGRGQSDREDDDARHRGHAHDVVPRAHGLAPGPTLRHRALDGNGRDPAAKQIAAGDRSKATLSLRYEGLLGGLLARLTRGITNRYLAMEAKGLKARSENPFFLVSS